MFGFKRKKVAHELVRVVHWKFRSRQCRLFVECSCGRTYRVTNEKVGENVSLSCDGKPQTDRG